MLDRRPHPSAQAETEKSENLFLYIDLPRFDFPVIFSEPVRPIHIPSRLFHLTIPKDATATLVAPTSTLATAVQTPATPTVPTNFLSDSNLWGIVDPDIVHENPVEDKHRRLVRSHRSSPYDRDLKPNAKNRDELAVRLHAFLLHAGT